MPIFFTAIENQRHLRTAWNPYNFWIYARIPVSEPLSCKPHVIILTCSLNDSGSDTGILAYIQKLYGFQAVRRCLWFSIAVKKMGIYTILKIFLHAGKIFSNIMGNFFACSKNPSGHCFSLFCLLFLFFSKIFLHAGKIFSNIMGIFLHAAKILQAIVSLYLVCYFCF